MPRPRKCRKLCNLPQCTHFYPAGTCGGGEIIMTLDEYEAIRLIDFEGLTQEQCAERMDVARTTAQSIYACARKKLAECIVNGRQLKISGGDIRLCTNRGKSCKFCCGQDQHNK